MSINYKKKIVCIKNTLVHVLLKIKVKKCKIISRLLYDFNLTIIYRILNSIKHNYVRTFLFVLRMKENDIVA